MFGYLILVMVLRPRGLLGEETREAGMSELRRPAAASGARRSSGALPAVVDHARLAAILIVIAIVLPFFFAKTSGFINATIIALAYVVMALGLNIVVGFAGLLDLGYVAFYALGAYCVGWFGSDFFFNAHVHIARPRRRRDLDPGSI